MQIDEKLIAYLEDLSCLALREEEKPRVAKDLEKILGEIARLSELDTEGRDARSHPFDHTNAFREDQTRASLDRALILQNAPLHSDGLFVAPQTVE